MNRLNPRFLRPCIYRALEAHNEDHQLQIFQVCLLLSLHVQIDVLTHTDKYFNNNGLIYTIFARL